MTNNNTNSAQPRVITRDGHSISRSGISPNAIKVLYRLHKSGYRACLVGGGVRDLLLGLEPKDFDVATDATPDEVRRLFRNCRLIGRRFRLAHVVYGREIIEVATFRGMHGDEDDRDALSADNGRILRDNVYGEIEEDAWRRDFTVNGLYYDIADFSVLDFVGGMQDLKAGVIRLIDPDADGRTAGGSVLGRAARFVAAKLGMGGKPATADRYRVAEMRYREDPVRMLRAVRFAVKLGFRIHPDSADPMPGMAGLLDDISPARLYDESIKLLLSGQGLQTYEMLRHYGLFERLFPLTEDSLAHEEQGFPHVLLARALANTDARIAEGKPVTPAFLFAVLLWEPVREAVNELQRDDPSLGEVAALQQAAAEVLSQQAKHTSIPKCFSLPMREIWRLQSSFAQRSGKRPERLFSHPRFRAAYDFLVLRAECGEDVGDLAEWWTRYQDVEQHEREAMLQPGPKKKARRRRSRGRSRQAQASTSES